MATIVLSAVGTAIGGPIGSTIGAMIGSQIDQMIFGPGDREGPRLEELAVTTSSYGAALPRHFGTMRAAGSIIWATDLVESSEDVGGGKGQPSTTTYSYSSSFAVALASRPIRSVRRIWADGNLLRGAAGDLKVGGELRVYHGTGDQLPDPLLASAEGARCPAYRGLAYCVFEDLQLGDYGNRIPALTFEIVADDGEVSLADMAAPADTPQAIARDLPSLEGFTDGGGPLRDTLGAIGQAYPFMCDTSRSRLDLFDGNPESDPVATLPVAVVDPSPDAFGGSKGLSRRQRADAMRVPTGMRYYDVERDFQPGLQRAGGQARKGRSRILEFPGALAARTARELADGAAQRASWSQEMLAYRVAEIDPALTPGRLVTVPGHHGKWRIEAWEWRDTGLELELIRLPHRKGVPATTDAGRSLTPRDEVPGETLLMAFELPWDGTASSDVRQIFAAPSSATSGWTGATLYAESGGSLVPIGGTGTRRSIIGHAESALAPGSAAFIDRQASVEVQLGSADFLLSSVTAEDIADGANRALLGDEIIQFCAAEPLGIGRWRLRGLLRGRGGTEHLAQQAVPAGANFVLLDGKPLVLDPAKIGSSTSVAAIGLADSAAVSAEIAGLGSTRRPLAPVRLMCVIRADGGWTLCWTRRSRGSWTWDGVVDVPLNEQSELYEIGIGDPDQPDMAWQSPLPELQLAPTEVSKLQTDHAGKALWVRQIGSHARSPASLFTDIA
ncbi:phage tail protein [Aurantiacibacter gangjinensis]|uniref:Uncharacterized protein n=1 Tax=Aurantiacibacter gangjinensis TaxID=502682 RepID=A0A0G9MLV9_9SPHN|nr:phage tail protein [Aurantiacibacter gangjinensis]APE27649.1 Gene Transfer Agent host specificity protein [Aurantiacibacter gangjinensis]KLE31670.1 hypothetical protein AAW01_09100 [Aurantiacibacter gangjinensis]